MNYLLFLCAERKDREAMLVQMQRRERELLTNDNNDEGMKYRIDLFCSSIVTLRKASREVGLRVGWWLVSSRSCVLMTKDLKSQAVTWTHFLNLN